MFNVACRVLIVLAGLISFTSLGHTLDRTGLPQEVSYESLNGKIIREIRIQVGELFEDPQNTFYSTANSLKLNTREEVVRRELLFREGEEFEDIKLKESERALRALGFLRKVKITPIVDKESVDIDIYVQDTWTLIPQLGFSSGEGSDSLLLGVSESNTAGFGKRVEALYRESDQRQTYEVVYDDNRLWGSQNRLLLGGFSRDDGERGVLFFGRPYRSLIQREAWFFSSDLGDTVGRLFENGEESYIFRQRRFDIAFQYTFAKGDPGLRVERFSLGYQYNEDTFSQADLSDYEDLDLDPSEVSNDPALLPSDRRFTGPVFSYRSITSDYVSANYIDRFERVADYNLGPEFFASMFAAPRLLGSDKDAVLLAANQTFGRRFDVGNFIRAELGGASRYSAGELSDTLIHLQAKYYNVLGPLSAGDIFLGKHTLAASFYIDYGDDLDGDRQLSIGADNALRGYDSRAFNGDKRFVLNLEDRMHFIDDAFKVVSIGSAAFLDVGASTYDRFTDMFSDDLYSNLGIGLRFAFPRSSGGKVLRLDLALPLRDGPDGSNEFEPRVILSGGQLFSSFLRSEGTGPERAHVEVGVDR